MKSFASLFRALAVVLVIAGVAAPVSARQRGERRAPDQQPAAEVESTRPRLPAEPMNAEATRESLMKVLEAHPPSVGRVLKMDATLMRNEAYLATYPQLRDFLAEHPEIPQNASYYFARVRGVDDHYASTPQQQMVEGILAGLAGMTAFVIILSTIVWLTKTLIDHRRWNRLSKIQAEVHTKLMDRFSSNEELLTYVQTPTGRRFLESGPSPLPEVGPAMGAPFTRILWSVQIGAILLVSGLGFLFLSARALPEAREFFYIAGCLATAVGAGFVVSAAAAYVLSRRLGLLERPVQGNA
jgi:hypothetical protein